ncbi:MAG: zinc-ribbon and DUF3426 domain-containing protein [Caldimonas sp.]|uniref:zinc-ribbon and DUF3426 domain-containing protein n=1 Tax=Caldimonas sp. TaxID=2838790 RepID=UPI00391B1FF1
MSLATRCPACHTAFRVVQDQLKVSEGWVRCGRCNEVFNALEGLFDLERDPAPTSGTAPASSPPEGSPTAAVQAGLGALLSRASSDVAPLPAHAPPPAAARPPAPAWRDAAGEDDAPTTSEVLDSRFLDRSTYGAQHEGDVEHEFADARLDSRLHGEDDADAPRPAAWTPRAAAPPAPLTRRRSPRERGAAQDEPAAATPSFLRRAEREARWRHPVVRAALGLAALLLMVGLALQWAHHERHWLAAHHPGTRPWLEQLCAWTGCRIGPWPSIEHVVVDSSSLSPGNTPDSYRLSVQLRNRADVPLAVPAIELALTDLQGQLVARRALLPSDFRSGDTLAARGDLTLRLDFRTPGHRVAGYTVEAFYP